MRAYDYWLFALINDLAGRWPWLDAVAYLFFNDYFAPTLLAIILLTLWFEGANPAEQERNQRAVLVAVCSTILGNSLLKLSNLLYFRPRPFAEHTVNLLFYQPSDSSLPSNATVIGFAIAGGVWFYNRAWGWGLLLIAALFGLSRIFGGVHYPLDVVTGAGLGWLSAWLTQRQSWLADALFKPLLELAKKLHLS